MFARLVIILVLATSGMVPAKAAEINLEAMEAICDNKEPLGVSLKCSETLIGMRSALIKRSGSYILAHRARERGDRTAAERQEQRALAAFQEAVEYRTVLEKEFPDVWAVR